MNKEQLDNPFVHLTNNAIQRQDKSSYGTFEEANQLSFEKASQILSEEGITCDFYDLCEQKMMPTIRLSLMSVRHTLNKRQRRHCFEIFGYDFIIDEQLKPWLIEVNTNPCLEESSKLLRMLLPRMIDDAFKLTLDQAFPAPFEELESSVSSFPVQGQENDENLWGAQPFCTLSALVLEKSSHKYKYL